MFDLATQLAAEKKIDAGLMEHDPEEGARGARPGAAPSVHGQARPSRAASVGHGLLRRRLGPAALLDQLETEDRRDKRRLLLDLLVVHGEEGARPRPGAAPGVARDAGQRLRPPQLDLPPAPRPPPRRRGGRGRDRRGSRASPPPPTRPSSRRRPSSTSGKAHHPRVARGARVAARLLGGGARARGTWTTPTREEGLAALDRVASALAKQGGPKGWSALVDHALSGRPELGDAAARLAELGTHDLSHAPAVLETLTREDPREPAEGCPRPPRGPQGPGPAGPRGRARRHARPGGPGAARGGPQALHRAGAGQGGGACARGPAPGRGRRGGSRPGRRPLGRARPLRLLRRCCTARPGQGHRHAQPPAEGGRRRPGHGRLLPRPRGLGTLGHREGPSAVYQLYRAAVRGQLRLRRRRRPARRRQPPSPSSPPS